MPNAARVTQSGTASPYLPQHVVVQPPFGDTAPTTLDLKYVFYTLLQRKWLILSVVLAFTLTTMVIMNRVAPMYTAKTSLLIGRNDAQLIDIRAAITEQNLDAAAIMSEVEILQSRQLASQVVDHLGLIDNPEFNPRLTGRDGALGKGESISILQRIQRGFQRMVGNTADISLVLTNNAQSIEHTVAVNILLDNLRVNPVSRSRVIAIQYNAHDPKTASLVANALAEQYIDNQLQEKRMQSRHASEWLDTRLEDLRTNLRQSEEELQIYSHQMIARDGQSKDMLAQQLSELSSYLVRAKSKHAEAKARLKEAYELLDNGSGVAAIVEVLHSNLIQRLTVEESLLHRRISEMETRYGPKHPKMIKLRAELKDLKNKIQVEVSSIIQSLETETRVAQVRQKALEDNIRQVIQQQTTFTAANSKLRELEQEVKTHQELFRAFLERYKSLTKQEELQTANATIISRANIPLKASFPNKKMVMLLSLLVSLMLGTLLAFIFNIMDNRFKSVKQVIEETGLPMLGLIPRLPRISKIAPSDYITRKPLSAIAESVRVLRTSINLINRESPPRVVNFTSSVAGEGKTTLSIWYARTVAKSGKRVILIDCDVRRPTIHKHFPHLPGFSLSTLLSKESEMEQDKEFLKNSTIATDPETGLHIIYADSVRASTLDLVSTERMQSLVNVLKKSYDLIVLDSPPSLGVSDGRLLAQVADASIYAIKADQTPRETVMAGLHNFHDFGLNISGIILTHVRPGNDAIYKYLSGSAKE